jgi:hypothetical protein
MENAQTLKRLVLDQFPAIPTVSDWHSAILDEVCENVIDGHPNLPLTDMANIAVIGYSVSLKSAESLIESGLRLAESLTLNYRGQMFVFHRLPH